jgi:hypothetical protein
MTVFRKVKRLITAEAYEAENYTFLSPSSLHPRHQGPLLLHSSHRLLLLPPGGQPSVHLRRGAVVSCHGLVIGAHFTQATSRVAPFSDRWCRI